MSSVEVCSKITRAVVVALMLDACGGTVIGKTGDGDRVDGSVAGAGGNGRTDRGDASVAGAGGRLGVGGSPIVGGAGRSISPEASGGAPHTVPCNDGTGMTNCCPPEALGSPVGPCDPRIGSCRTPCSRGGFSGRTCSPNGVWATGLGIFSCGGVTACNDGTGSADCCTEGVAEGKNCYDSAPRCSPGGCQRGFKRYLDCQGGEGAWVAEEAIFPCGSDAGAADATDSGSALLCEDGGTLEIRASSYDRTCVLNSDCVAVGEGDACKACPFSCPNTAINVAAKANYDADVARTPAGHVGISFCGCPMSFGPCCINGYCRSDLACVPASP